MCQMPSPEETISQGTARKHHEEIRVCRQGRQEVRLEHAADLLYELGDGLDLLSEGDADALEDLSAEDRVDEEPTAQHLRHETRSEQDTGGGMLDTGGGGSTVGRCRTPSLGSGQGYRRG